MNDDQLPVRWLPAARKLLGKRDRYTREAIERDFKQDPRREAIEFDQARHCWVTPVADNRYSVIWHMDPDGSVAIVEAVVPVHFVGDDREQLKNQVNEVVRLAAEA